MCAVSKTLSNQKLKIKFVAKKVEAEPVTQSCEFGDHSSLIDEN